QTIPSAAKSRSASSNTVTAFFPPISREVRFNNSPARPLILAPTSFDPVNETRSISGCSTIALPTTLPEPYTRLMSPFGSPASSYIFTNSAARNGVSDAGFQTTALPATNAGSDFHEAMAIGKFHGVIRPATPTG